MRERIVLLVTTTPKTCTVRLSADGTLCGEPAVRIFTSGLTGIEYAECETHDVGPGHGHIAQIAPGVRAEVPYRGETRIGTVVRVARVNVDVEIPLASGGTKTITRRIDEITVR